MGDADFFESPAAVFPPKPLGDSGLRRAATFCRVSSVLTKGFVAAISYQPPGYCFSCSAVYYVETAPPRPDHARPRNGSDAVGTLVTTASTLFTTPPAASFVNSPAPRACPAVVQRRTSPTAYVALVTNWSVVNSPNPFHTVAFLLPSVSSMAPLKFTPRKFFSKSSLSWKV